MSKIILIVGPTGTGKTTLSIKLAKKYYAVILNADSTQVYTEPLIATAKIKEHEKENIEHYLFDVVSLNDDYTLYDYQKDGRRLLDRFISKNKNVIIVGGSGLYVKALLYNYVLEDKKEIDIDFSEYSNEELKNKVLALDPQSDIDYSDVYISYSNVQLPKTPEEIVIQKEILDFVAKTIKNIDSEHPDKNYLQIYTLRYDKGMTQKEISEELGLSQSEISKRLYRLMEKVKDILG